MTESRRRHVILNPVIGLMLLGVTTAPVGAQGRILGEGGSLFSSTIFDRKPDELVRSDLIDRINRFADKALLLRSFPKTSALWPDGIVYVCWEQFADSPEDKRALVRRSVEESWAAVSALSFRGWGECVAESAGVRIAVLDNLLIGPHVKKLGNEVDGIKDGMVLNLTFQNWSRSCQSKADECIRTITVHEFGHAIGFAHEQNRFDTPGDCFEPAQGENGDTMDLTPWDKDSVMNYCANGFMADGKLSELDIKSVQVLYGERP